MYLIIRYIADSESRCIVSEREHGLIINNSGRFYALITYKGKVFAKVVLDNMRKDTNVKEMWAN